MDMFVGDALADGHVAFHPSQVSRDGVAGIEREELALDIGDQVVGRIHAGDFGHGALECGALDVPFEEAFDDHVDRVLALDRRHDAVDRAVGEADVLLAPVTLGLVEVLEDSLPELCGGADAVFAGDDIERLGDACIPACGDTRRDGSGDAGQHGQPHRRGDEFRPGDLGGKFRAPGVHCRNVGNAHLLADRVHDLNRIGPVRVDPRDDLFVHIGEYHMVARLFQHGADKSAADVPGSELNSFLHCIRGLNIASVTKYRIGCRGPSQR